MDRSGFISCLGALCSRLYSLEWAASDQLVFSIVSAALRITSSQSQYSDRAVEAIVTFINEIVKNVQTSTCKLAFKLYH